METRLLEYMESNHMDAFYITKQANIRYISRYMGGDAFLLITKACYYILTDPRCTEQAEKECPEYKVVNWRPFGSVAACIGSIVKRENLRSVAFEEDHVNYNQWAEMKKEIPAELMGTSGIIDGYRTIKTPEEIQYLKNACDLASRAYEMLLKDVRVGITEKELESKLSYYMVSLGGDTKPNFNLCISGTRTSLLHGIPSTKSIEPGDLVLLDFGIEYRGYTSDMTRVFVVGKATRKQKEVYDYALRMLEAGLSQIHDGVKAKDVCHAVEEVIRGTEYEKYYYSSIGHGIGLFVHESPFLRPNSEDIIRENNVMAVEPGIFIPGWGGIHLEDDILVTKDGYVNLTTASRELLEL